MKSLTLHPLTPPDLPAWAEAFSCWRPDSPRTAAELAERDRLRTVDEVVQRFWVCGSEEQRVGVLELETPRAENHPGWLQLRVGTPQPELLPRLLDLGHRQARELNAAALIARVREDRPELAAHLKAGFAEYDRTFSSRLDLACLDVGKFADREAAVQAAGVHILPLEQATLEAGWGEFAQSEAAQRRLYALVVSRLAAVPGVVSYRPWSFEVWRERAADRYDPTLVFVAVSPAGEWVGLTELFAEASGALRTGLTGVEPAWQGRGVAYALKLAALRAARERGYHSVDTVNHQRNAPMLAVNRALGFVPNPATVLLRRRV
ncbi:GNAT family N-acetyltransferase [Deinococcus piscis]|uniref:GNAT family N-acetyltransferase n=1 Tax=Deinococcus piscis TaxID=394230 RepID=A0ABQ3KED6_9DEIO|nr:GNAT family N-acetyltransferase [Deinococcus piscis]GHG06988.1 GNAT family N-acetyltransferase [Deinococcus piscis]